MSPSLNGFLITGTIISMVAVDGDEKLNDDERWHESRWIYVFRDGGRDLFILEQGLTWPTDFYTFSYEIFNRGNKTCGLCEVFVNL